MVPLIMAIASMAKQKAASENQALQNQADALRQTPIQVQPQPQFPTINSVFGNY